MDPSSSPLKILIAGGGTGGHLFPGLAIAEEFAGRLACDIRFVGTKRGLESRVIPQTPFRLYKIPISGLYRVGFRRKLLTLARMPFAFMKSLFVLLTFRPHFVIGIGGYASGPVLALALLLRKKTVIQEQNAYPGMTNRILGRYVDLAFIPFEKSRELFENPVVVGNPIRKSVTASPIDKPEKSDTRATIAIVGGSQGAHILNQTMVDALPLFESLSDRIRIIHQTGKTDCSRVREQYSKYPMLKADATEFIDDMGKLYQQTDLLICRSGSMIYEIIAMGIPSILVPISISSGDHQKENAKTMVDNGASLMIEEKTLTPQTLFESVKSLLEEEGKLEMMGEEARSLYQGNSAEMIVSGIIDHFKLTRFK